MLYEGFEKFEVQTTDPEVRIVGRKAGKGPPLLLLHGNPLSHRSWSNVAPRLATVTTSGTAYNGTASVVFTATFSEAVTGVTAADFVVDRGLGIGGVVPVVAGVTGAGIAGTRVTRWIC